MSARVAPRIKAGRTAVLAALACTGLGALLTAPAPASALAAPPASVAISAGGEHSCAIESGQVYCWGGNGHGQFGDGLTIGTAGPSAAADTGAVAGKDLVQISAGYKFTCALDSAGAAYCWGQNADGQLGDGGSRDAHVPVAVDTSGVLAGKMLTQITAGTSFTCALDAAGAAYCWGKGYSDVPVAVDTSGVLAGKTLTQITAGADHECALDTAGAAYCWGDDTAGELGNGSHATVPQPPVAVDTSGVLAGKTLTQISAGWQSTCVLDSAGAPYCWGLNQYGELGTGTSKHFVYADVPVAVPTGGVLAGKTLVQIAAGGYEVCALDQQHAVYCWGHNPHGLGSRKDWEPSTKGAVDMTGALAGKTVTQITAGHYDMCAVDTSGAVYCWGPDPEPIGPYPPQNVTATPGSTSIDVSWTPPAGTATIDGYYAIAVQHRGSSCATTSATSCTITGLASHTTYHVIVLVNAHGETSGSAVLTVTTLRSG